jgi:hypothetical protein
LAVVVSSGSGVDGWGGGLDLVLEAIGFAFNVLIGGVGEGIVVWGLLESLLGIL